MQKKNHGNGDTHLFFKILIIIIFFNNIIYKSETLEMLSVKLSIKQCFFTFYHQYYICIVHLKNRQIVKFTIGSTSTLLIIAPIN